MASVVRIGELTRKMAFTQNFFPCDVNLAFKVEPLDPPVGAVVDAGGLAVVVGAVVVGLGVVELLEADPGRHL